MDPIILDEPKFTLSQAATLSGYSARMIQSLVSRGHLPITSRPGTGTPCLFSRREVLRLALMYDLGKRGIAPASSALAANIAFGPGSSLPDAPYYAIHSIQQNAVYADKCQSLDEALAKSGEIYFILDVEEKMRVMDGRISGLKPAVHRGRPRARLVDASRTGHS